MIHARTQLCMVIGHPVEHSLSPLLHNTGYKSLGIDDNFVYVACDVKPDDIADFVAGIRAMHVRGVSCTMPHKEIIMPHLDEIDPVAKQIGAVNTVVQKRGKLYGYNTDWIGVVEPLKAVTPLKGKHVGIIGAGGAARAMVYGLVREGALVTIYNRTLQKAEALAKEFDCKAASLADQASLQQADIICNATSLGMHPQEDQMPIESEFISPNHIVFEAIYNPRETRLVKEAKASGAHIVYGSEMLLYQAMAQFKLYTGQEAPEHAMRQALSKEVKL